MNTRLCANGHVMDASWDRCPYCPPAAGGASPSSGAPAPARRPVPPTRVDMPGAAPPLAPPAPPPLTLPAALPCGAPPASPATAVPLNGAAPPPYRRPDAAARRTRVREVEAAAEKAIPFLGWLVVFTGNHRFEDFRIREGRNAIGSDPSNQIVLTDDHVSARHATINATLSKEGERVYVLRDLDSRNGTFLNEGQEQVYHEELVDNDTVFFGTVKCKFKCL